MPDITLTAFAIVFTIEIFFIIFKYGLGLLSGNIEIKESAKREIAGIIIFAIIALLIINGLVGKILDIINYNGLKQAVIERLNTNLNYGIGLLVFLTWINGIVSTVPLLDGINKLVDTVEPILGLIVAFSYFVKAIFEFFTTYGLTFLTISSILLVPKVTRSIGAAIFAISLAFMIFLPISFYIFYDIKDIHKEINELKKREGEIKEKIGYEELKSEETQKASLTGTLEKIIGIILNITSILGPIIKLLLDAVKTLFMNLVVIPILAYIIALLAAGYLYNILSGDKLDALLDRIFLASRFVRI